MNQMIHMMIVAIGQDTYSMYTHWHIIDARTQEVVVEKLLDLVQANETLQILQLQNPNTQYEIVETQQSSVKPGFGRDPDLH